MDPTTLTEEERRDEELVAYLDGELDDDRRVAVERRLADDEAYRNRMRELSRAWDLLDWLPASTAGAQFAQTTVEMAAVQALGQSKQAERRRRLGWLLAASAILAALIVGYATVDSWLSAPDRQLLHDLPVVENVDMYENAESVEFLQSLHEAGLFEEESEDESP